MAGEATKSDVVRSRSLKRQRTRLKVPVKKQAVQKPRESFKQQVQRERREALYADKSCPDYCLLPDVVLMKIFEYLSIRDRCRAGQTCRKWYSLTQSEIFWKKVKMEGIAPFELLKIIPNLPSCVTHLFFAVKYMHLSLSMLEIMVQIQNSCPVLQTLIVDGVILKKFVGSFEENLKQSTKCLQYDLEVQCCKENFGNTEKHELFLPELKVLSLMTTSTCISSFHKVFSTSSLPNLRVLNVKQHNFKFSDSGVDYVRLLASFYNLEELYLVNASVFDCDVACLLQCMKNLKVLDLEKTLVGYGDLISNLMKYGQSLEKLFLGCTAVDLNVTDEITLPQLKTLCLRHTKVTPSQIKDLLKSCPSLTCVNVTEHEVSRECLQFLPKVMRKKLVYPDNVLNNAKVCFHFYMEGISSVFGTSFSKQYIVNELI